MKNHVRLFLLIMVLFRTANAQTKDPSFGKQGNAFANFVYDANPDHIDPAGNRATAIQPDGKILMAFIHNFSSSGEAGLPGENGFSVMRLHPDGNLDSAFGIDGVKVIAPGAGAYLHFMNLQSDGKILLGGTVYPFEQQLILYRLTNDGRIDSSFNAIGYARLSPAGPFDYSIGDVIQRPDGKYLLVGEQNYNSTSNKILVTLLKENGTVDSSF